MLPISMPSQVTHDHPQDEVITLNSAYGFFAGIHPETTHPHIGARIGSEHNYYSLDRSGACGGGGGRGASRNVAASARDQLGNVTHTHSAGGASQDVIAEDEEDDGYVISSLGEDRAQQDVEQDYDYVDV